MSYQSTVLADTPLRYYRLDEASGTVTHDLGSQAQNGTLSGGITLSQVGLIVNDLDTSMLFNGSTGSISLPTTSLPIGVQAWSIEVWIQLPSIPGAGNYPVAFEWGTNATGQFAAFYFNGDDGQIESSVQSAPDLKGGAITANTHYHLVSTYNGTTVLFYVNGIQKDSKTITLSIGTTGADIGKDLSGSLWWNGIIDEVAIYSTTLSQARVIAHYQAGTTSQQKSPQQGNHRSFARIR